MNLNIEEQIPVKSKIYRDKQIYIPENVRRFLEWNIGDKIEMFATKEGVFIRKDD